MLVIVSSRVINRRATMPTESIAQLLHTLLKTLRLS
jgi:hypothetical protein